LPKKEDMSNPGLPIESHLLYLGAQKKGTVKRVGREKKKWPE